MRILCAAGALLLLIALWDVKRIHGHRQAAHKESAERQGKEAVARWEEEEEERKREEEEGTSLFRLLRRKLAGAAARHWPWPHG